MSKTQARVSKARKRSKLEGQKRPHKKINKKEQHNERKTEKKKVSSYAA